MEKIATMQPNTRADGSTSPAHVQNVNATAGGLAKATLGAAVVAGAILTFVWLPAEYGIDPTGAGHLLGLTQMGHIKEQLHAEADADAAAALAAQADQSDQSVAINADIHQRLDSIEAQLSAIAAAQSAAQPAVQSATQSAAAQVNLEPIPATTWLHENHYKLANGEGIEVKMVMEEGAVADFEWTANGAVLNHDTHGDGSGQNISYEKGRSVPEQSGKLTAAFTGNHGWYWRNRTGVDVELTLRTRGDYSDLVLP